MVRNLFLAILAVVLALVFSAPAYSQEVTTQETVVGGFPCGGQEIPASFAGPYMNELSQMADSQCVDSTSIIEIEGWADGTGHKEKWQHIAKSLDAGWGQERGDYLRSVLISLGADSNRIYIEPKKDSRKGEQYRRAVAKLVHRDWLTRAEFNAFADSIRRSAKEPVMVFFEADRPNMVVKIYRKSVGQYSPTLADGNGTVVARPDTIPESALVDSLILEAVGGGYYAHKQLQPGSYIAVFTAPGYSQCKVSFRVHGGAGEEFVEADLQPIPTTPKTPFFSDWGLNAGVFVWSGGQPWDLFVPTVSVVLKAQSFELELTGGYNPVAQEAPYSKRRDAVLMGNINLFPDSWLGVKAGGFGGWETFSSTDQWTMKVLALMAGPRFTLGRLEGCIGYTVSKISSLMYDDQWNHGLTGTLNFKLKK